MNINTIIKNFLIQFCIKYKRNYASRLSYNGFYFLRKIIESWTPLLSNSEYKLSTKIYWIIHDIKEFPKCKNESCSNTLEHKNVYTIEAGYRLGCCSNKCTQLLDTVRQKVKQRNKELYGYECILSNDGKRDEINNILMKKYGTTTVSKLDYFKNKTKQTCLKKYGVDSTNKLKSVQDKKEATFNKHYGCKSILCLKSFHKDAKKIKKEKYGDENYNNHEQIEQTCLKRYNVKYPAQNHDIYKKSKKRYIYKSIRFDSSWEIAYYIFNEDHNISILPHPKVDLKYKDQNNREHYYFPDFYNCSLHKYVEIKGDNLFNSKGEPFYNGKSWKDKYDFMISIGVIILTKSDMKKYLSYCYQKFKNKQWYLKYRV